jgi:ParB-like chromosome segregation protein Spo0J
MKAPPVIDLDVAAEPVSRVEWVHRSKLTANDYNPNRVAPPELELLILSILEDHWTQPIVVLPDGTIVDGFHRWEVSADPRLEARYHGMVPIVRIALDPVHRKLSTIRHNRARGTHAILPMADIVRDILQEGVSHEELCRRLGMESEEVVRLATRLGMPELGQAKGFTPAWKPGPRNGDNPGKYRQNQKKE